MEQGSASNGTITDIDGKFTLSLPSNSVLAVTYVGFSTKNIPVNNQNAIQIVMEEDSEILEEVVVVAYGTQKKISSTAAVSSMKTKDVAQSRLSIFLIVWQVVWRESLQNKDRENRELMVLI